MANTHAVTDLTSLREVLTARHPRPVVLSPSLFDSDEAGKLQAQINRLVFECGCNMSAGLLLLAVAACILADVICWPTVEQHPLRTLGINLLACLAGVGVGKAWGLFRARRSLIRLVRAIEDRLTAESHLLGDLTP